MPMLTDAANGAPPALTCDAFGADVFAALDGELDPATGASVDAHLAGCPACRERLRTDAVFHRAVRRAVTLDIAPPSLRARVAVLLHTRTTEIASA